MKTFTIPLVNKVFIIYIGKREWRAFAHDTVVNGAHKEDPDAPWPGEGCGRASGGWIWVNEKSDSATIIHELSHFIDDLMSSLHNNNTEFRAYLTEWVFHTVLAWAGALIKE